VPFAVNRKAERHHVADLQSLDRLRHCQWTRRALRAEGRAQGCARLVALSFLQMIFTRRSFAAVEGVRLVLVVTDFG
jgi:hypothetical protein